VAATIDRWHERHPRASVPLAVVYKFFDDQGNLLAAMLTYYAFVAIFPLMLLGATILGLVLEDRPDLQDQLLDSALGQFPIIGDQLGRPDGLEGSPTTLVVGSLIALYGAVGLGQSIQHTQNLAWAVPRNSRPNPFFSRLRSLGLLSIAGIGLLSVSIAAEVISAAEVFGDLPGGIDWVRLVNVLFVGSVFTLMFRFAGGRRQSLRRAAPGAFAVAVQWQLLQIAGAEYVERVLVGTSAMTQTFGLVLGLIGLIYIAAVMAVVGIEINVVLARKLYPRALLTLFTDRVRLTEADRRAYTGLARAQRLKGFQTVSVSFDASPLEQEAVEATGDAADDDGQGSATPDEVTEP
jgi:YihY family inner membrane protein